MRHRRPARNSETRENNSPAPRPGPRAMQLSSEDHLNRTISTTDISTKTPQYQMFMQLRSSFQEPDRLSIERRHSFELFNFRERHKACKRFLQVHRATTVPDVPQYVEEEGHDSKKLSLFSISPYFLRGLWISIKLLIMISGSRQIMRFGG